MNVLRAAVAVALAGGALAAAASPAAANRGFDYFTTLSSGTCEVTTGEWIVDWAVSNHSTREATLTDVEFSPTPAALPRTVAGGATVHAVQRIPGTGTMGSLTYTATWSGGGSSLNNWYFKPRTQCLKTTTAEAAQSWAVNDEAGAYRGSITGEPGLANVCDPLADGVQVSVEAQLSDGSTVKRIAPLGGCTPFKPFNGATVTAVRGFAGTYANSWHPVS